MSAPEQLLHDHSTILTLLREPLYEIWYQATQSRTAATIFVLVIAILWLFTLLGVQQTASRLTWSFARDGAFFWSAHLKRIDKKLNLPIWAMLFNFVGVFALGCVYLASSTGRLTTLCNNTCLTSYHSIQRDSGSWHYPRAGFLCHSSFFANAARARSKISA